MSLSSKINTTGLVFEIDTTDPFSYRGEPATNLVYSQSLAWNVYAYATYYGPMTAYDPNSNIVNTRRYTISNAVNTARAALIPTSTIGLPYVFTCLIKYNGNNTSAPTFTVSAAKPFPEASNTIVLSQSTQTTTALGNNWYLLTYYYTVSSNTVSQNYLTYGTDTGAATAYIGNTFDVYNEQLEQNTHPTTYTVNGRTSGQCLFDSCKYTGIDLISARYDTNSTILYTNSLATFVSAGTNSNIVPSSTGDWTWDTWFYLNSSDTSTYRGIYSKYGASTATQAYYGLHFSVGQLNTLRLEASDVGSSTRALDNSFTMPGLGANVWYNVTVTYSYSTSAFKVYGNGKYVGTSTSWPYGLGTNNVGPLRVGMIWAGSFNGYIPIHRQYNRALSDIEISQNYNRIKSRFGLT